MPHLYITKYQPKYMKTKRKKFQTNIINLRDFAENGTYVVQYKT